MNIQSNDVSVPKIAPRPKTAFELAAFGARTLASLCAPVTFAFLGGYADASGYVITGAFTGHITGAIVLAALGAASQDWRNFILRLGGIAGFLIGVAIAETLVEEFGRRLSHYVFTLLIAIELILFSLGYLSFAHHLNSARAPLVLCLSLALGLQNGVWRRVGGAAAVHTTFLTGLSINLMAAETDEKFVYSRGASNTSSMKLPADILTAFFLGATLGAVAAFHFQAGAIVGTVPLLVLMMTASAVRPNAPPSASTR